MPSPKEIEALIDKFKETIEQWPREGGLFVELMGKKIAKIGQDFAQDVATQLPKGTFAKKTNHAAVANKDQTEVYVALYQMNGDNLERWAMMLHALAAQAISRPVYENEQDVCNMIRNKQQKNREAYVIVNIPTHSVIKMDRPLLDSSGRSLVQIKAGTLKPENIVRFVHMSGQYLWENGKLIKLDLPSPIMKA